MVYNPAEVPLNQCTQRGQQRGGAGSQGVPESPALLAITETWWGESHDRSGAIDGYRLFRRDGAGRRGRGIDLLLHQKVD